MKIFNFFKRKKEYIFPCKECLVNTMCSQVCDKLIMNNDKIREFFCEYNCCPDCGSKEFFNGPCGGLCENVKCAGCNHWFNIALPMVAERIHIDSNGVFTRK